MEMLRALPSSQFSLSITLEQFTVYAVLANSVRVAGGMVLQPECLGSDGRG